MTRLFDATHGQVQEFIKKLSIVGFTTEHLQYVLRDPYAMERWVRLLDVTMECGPIRTPSQEGVLVADAFASDGVLAAALKRGGMHTLADVADWTHEELADVRIIGKKRLELIETVLTKHGLTFSSHGPHDADRVLNVDKSRAHLRSRVDGLKIVEFIAFTDHDFADSFGRYRMDLTVGDVRFMDNDKLAEHFTPGGINKIRSWIEENIP